MIKLLLSFVLLLNLVPSSGTSKPDFSGHWVFNPQKSHLQVPTPDSMEMTIEHREPVFKISRLMIRKEERDEWNTTLSVGGSEIEEKDGAAIWRTRIDWSGDSLVLFSRVTMNGREATNEVRYSLSEEGRVLTAEESFKGPRLKYDNTWILEKKPD